MELVEHQLLDNIKTLHEQNAKLQQEVDRLKQTVETLTETNKELNRKLKSIQALFL